METIDMTPSWESLVLSIAEMYVMGTKFDTRKIGEDELLRMARLADAYVTSVKTGVE